MTTSVIRAPTDKNAIYDPMRFIKYIIIFIKIAKNYIIIYNIIIIILSFFLEIILIQFL